MWGHGTATGLPFNSSRAYGHWLHACTLAGPPHMPTKHPQTCQQSILTHAADRGTPTRHSCKRIAASERTNTARAASCLLEGHAASRPIGSTDSHRHTNTHTHTAAQHQHGVCGLWGTLQVAPPPGGSSIEQPLQAQTQRIWGTSINRAVAEGAGPVAHGAAALAFGALQRRACLCTHTHTHTCRSAWHQPARGMACASKLDD